MCRHRIDDTNAKTIRRINRAGLVFVDDIGLLPTNPDAPEGFLRAIDAAYERRNLAVSSNLRPSNVDTIMPKTLAAAAVDRLQHHGYVSQVNGGSLRLKETAARKRVRKLNKQAGRTRCR